MVVSRAKNKKGQSKIRLLAFILGGMLIIALALIIATPRDTTTTPTDQTPVKSEGAADQPETKPQGEGGDTGGTATPNPQTPPASPQQPATLANCQYEGGPPSGRQCPATPPASYSATVNCYGTSTEPITCPDWSYMRRIAVDKVDGVSYCLFTFWGGGTSETYYRSKKVKVTNNANPNGFADCSVEQPLE